MVLQAYGNLEALLLMLDHCQGTLRAVSFALENQGLIKATIIRDELHQNIIEMIKITFPDLLGYAILHTHLVGPL